MKNIFEEMKLEEFKNTPYINNTLSDELIIRKARIHKIMGAGDDRLQVQPMPEFMKIPEEELDNLPVYPMFFNGQMITGDPTVDDSQESDKKRKNNLKKNPAADTSEEKDKAEFVWCLCTRDFTVGYVLAKCNVFGSGVKEEKFKDSYSWKDVKSFLQQRTCCPEDFDYKNLIVQTFFSTKDGGMINCYNRKTGDWVLLNTTGSILTVQQKEIYMRVGSPPNPVSSGPVGFSMIKMTGDKILFKSPNIEFDYHDLILGHNGMNAVGTLTQGPIIGRNGVNGIPIPSIHV